MSDDELGPIDYLTVEFGAGQISEEDASILLDAVDSGVVRVLDLEFVVKEADGSVQRVDVDEIKNPAGVDLSVWKDATRACSTNPTWPRPEPPFPRGAWPGSLATRTLWTLTLDAVLHHHGARLIADGRIAPEDVLTALDQRENR